MWLLTWRWFMVYIFWKNFRVTSSRKQSTDFQRMFYLSKNDPEVWANACHIWEISIIFDMFSKRLPYLRSLSQCLSILRSLSKYITHLRKCLSHLLSLRKYPTHFLILNKWLLHLLILCKCLSCLRSLSKYLSHLRNTYA